MPARGGDGRRTPARQPKYLRIYDEMTEQISSGVLAPGTPLPSQRELSEAFGVTLMTLRQALRLLEDEGVIETRHGTGTFVATPRYEYGLDHLHSFAQDMALQGKTIQTDIVSGRVLVAPPGVATELGLRSGARALAIRRVRRVENAPVVLQDSYLPLRIGRRLDIAQLAHRSLYAVLAGDLGVRVVRATEAFRAVTLDEEQAETLDRDIGSAAILSRRVSYSDSGQAVIDDIAVLAGDSVVMTAARNHGGLSLSYMLDTSTTASNQFATSEGDET